MLPSQVHKICGRIGVDTYRVVGLSSVKDDEYPPVLKNTAMLHHLSTMIGPDEAPVFEWVLKVDDDTLVNLPSLLATLGQLPSPRDNFFYLGAKGTGRRKDKGKLGIVKPFCMGGPGYALSRAVLVKIGPGIRACARAQQDRSDSSWHSDVIIGHCIYKQVGIGCWDREGTQAMRYHFNNHFFQRYLNKSIDFPTGDALAKIITAHPLKQSTLVREMFRRQVEAVLAAPRTLWQEKKEKKKTKKVETKQQKKRKKVVPQAGLRKFAKPAATATFSMKKRARKHRNG